MAEELCRAVYTAYQSDEAVVVIAVGEHNTAGYKVRFQDTPIAVFPPEYRLVHRAPSGPAADVITPFVVSTSFPASDPVDAVVVHDARGRNRVRVRQFPGDRRH